MSDVLQALWNQHQSLPTLERPAFYAHYLWPALKFRFQMAGIRQQHTVSIHILDDVWKKTALEAIFLRSKRVLVLHTSDQTKNITLIEQEVGRKIEPIELPDLNKKMILDTLDSLLIEKAVGKYAVVLKPYSSATNCILLQYATQLESRGVNLSIFSLERAGAETALNPLETRMVLTNRV
jgi:hypothetical protein